VFLGADFITVTKGQGDWQHLKPAVLGVIMEHYLSGAPVILDQPPQAAGVRISPRPTRRSFTHIKELLDSRVRPAVAQDGGDITFQGYRDGVVFLNMRGSCSGCPSSTATLKHGIENLLRHFIPEVTEVRPV
jgi:Fe-S cluster biogenesis protein NfuA